MTEFVFLPDEGADAALALAALGAVADMAPVMPPMLIEAAISPMESDGNAAVVLERAPPAVRPRGRGKVTVLKVAPETGAALVEAGGRATGKPREVPGGKLYKVVNYRMAVADVRLGRSRLGASIGPLGADFFMLRIRSSMDGNPIPGAVVTLRLKGSTTNINGVSDATGTVVLGVRAPALREATLLIEPGFAGHWGFLSRRIDLTSGDSIDLDPIDLSATPDSLRHLVKPGQPADGAGVVVAVIDSGVGPHPDLPTALGDPDTSIGHGTHVAGIIAGNGPGGLAGVAPAAAIRSYRVFDDEATGQARNFEVHQAIVRAAADGCHLINLSLKSELEMDGTFDDPVISIAIEQASRAGALVVAAAGNDFRRFVAFPARHRDAVAVSAIGWEPGLPPNAYDRWTISTDRCQSDETMFFATFSNEGVSGTGIAITAPGTGIVSTVPGNRYAPMSGTSMACPAAVGAIARLLSANPHVRDMPADRTRRDAIWNLVLAHAREVGLGKQREGAGMLS